MKRDFDSKDLKEEYRAYYDGCKNAYLTRHPDADDYLCETYATKMVRKLARKLYDYKQLVAKIDANAELNEILLLHKSCAERSCDSNYYSVLNDVFLSANCVLDIGCGLNPCIVMSEFPNLVSYYCYDKDKRITELLQKLNEKYLNNRLSILSETNWNECNSVFQLKPDVVLVQKLVPNLFYGHNIKATNRIAQVDAKLWFVTGSIQSLSRNVSIQNEEKTALEWFIAYYGFEKVRYIQTSGEFGWLVSRPTRA